LSLYLLNSKIQSFVICYSCKLFHEIITLLTLLFYNNFDIFPSVSLIFVHAFLSLFGFFGISEFTVVSSHFIGLVFITQNAENICVVELVHLEWRLLELRLVGLDEEPLAPFRLVCVLLVLLLFSHFIFKVLVAFALEQVVVEPDRGFWLGLTEVFIVVVVLLEHFADDGGPVAEIKQFPEGQGFVPTVDHLEFARVFLEFIEGMDLPTGLLDVDLLGFLVDFGTDPNLVFVHHADNVDAPAVEHFALVLLELHVHGELAHYFGWLFLLETADLLDAWLDFDGVPVAPKAVLPHHELQREAHVGVADAAHLLDRGDQLFKLDVVAEHVVAEADGH